VAYVFSCTLTSTFYKLLEIERTRFARREGEPTPAALTQPATAVQGPMSAPLPGTAPGVSSRSSAPRAGLGAVQHYHTRCAPAAHLSSLSLGEGLAGALRPPRMAAGLRTISARQAHDRALAVTQPGSRG